MKTKEPPSPQDWTPVGLPGSGLGIGTGGVGVMRRGKGVERWEGREEHLREGGWRRGGGRGRRGSWRRPPACQAGGRAGRGEGMGRVDMALVHL